MEIAEIIKQLSIHTVLEHYGIKKNRNKMVCCPFHDDKNPSMQVYADTNTVFCFSGNCKMNGKKIDAIQFIQDKENIIKHEAIKKPNQWLNKAYSQYKQNQSSKLKTSQKFLANSNKAFTAVAKQELMQKAEIFTMSN